MLSHEAALVAANDDLRAMAAMGSGSDYTLNVSVPGLLTAAPVRSSIFLSIEVWLTGMSSSAHSTQISRPALQSAATLRPIMSMEAHQHYTMIALVQSALQS